MRAEVFTWREEDHLMARRHPGAEHTSPSAIQKHLKGIRYPASKQDLIDRARANLASQEVIRSLERLPGDEFGGPQDVMKLYAAEIRRTDAEKENREEKRTDEETKNS
jgi:hypothetical protein